VGYLVAELHPSKGVGVKKVATYLENIGFEVHIRQQWLRATAMLEAVNKNSLEPIPLARCIYN